ncbi:methionyl-tRNA formyltransferase [Humidisolicoccus flavus]|uniref:methionyl-tRNA formyltransferase n=1 Tax=Humidisolicoccus flavus TaxID=3111414 RepID=UPI003245F27A
MRIIFAGSPAAALPSLQQLALDHEIAAVLTRAPSPQGRKRVLTRTPVAEWAASEGITVIERNTLTEQTVLELEPLNAELGVIVAFGALVKEPLLSLPKLGWINLHFSDLPLYRGAAPVQRALIDGQTSTATSVFQLVPELDAGALFSTEHQEIKSNETAGELLRRLADSGAHQLARTVKEIAQGTASAVEQNGDPTFAPKLHLQDALLDVALGARATYARFRGVTPEPGAFVTIDGAKLKVHAMTPAAADAPRIETGTITLHDGKVLLGASDGILELVTVQPAGKPRMNAADWLRGRGGSVQIDPGGNVVEQ